MRPPSSLLLLAALSLVGAPGCDTKSNLEPTEPLTSIDGPETMQLCRYTTDVLANVDGSCDGDAPATLQSFDGCIADPPWDECAAPADQVADVGSWEDCVNRLLEGFCEPRADERCWQFRCR